jgi:hypothetical protein
MSHMLQFIPLIFRAFPNSDSMRHGCDMKRKKVARETRFFALQTGECDTQGTVGTSKTFLLGVTH